MRYLLLIYTQAGEQLSQAQTDQLMDEYWAYEKAVADAGIRQGSEALQGVDTATTVRLREGERIVTDGPFAETNEVLGGYYQLDVPDLDTALDWAARCPGAKYGSVEVRPLHEFEQPPAIG